MLNLLLGTKVNWRRVLGIGTAAVVVVLIAQVRLQQIALDRAELAYKNPRRVEIVRTVKVEGPVRVVTRIVREPSGRTEETREEVRGTVVTTNASEFRIEPVFESAARASGWVTGGGLMGLAPWQTHDVEFCGGYRFGGRLDVLGKVNGAGRGGFLLLWRW